MEFGERWSSEIMTAEQKKNREQAVLNLLYLYKKYYPVVEREMKKGQLYNKLRAVIGDNITLSSQTYRNSEYTVFIRMGSMGGNQASAQDAVAVYGQWNGTNL